MAKLQPVRGTHDLLSDDIRRHQHIIEQFRRIAERSGILDLFGGKPMLPGSGSAADMVDAGTWFVGTPEQVSDQILHQYQVTGGFGTLLQLGYDPLPKQG